MRPLTDQELRVIYNLLATQLAFATLPEQTPREACKFATAITAAVRTITDRAGMTELAFGPEPKHE